ncbi:MAG: 7-carboxy-7-deazaguanine synthase [Methanoregula sp. PtaU1.Bin051]|nr:MAG: 7-carboxy-7-deazaguanine synthase [Methanoregula sp. PtaU1.Bin051]
MRISEIFYSIQGEGRNQGAPALFIRLAGCNLHCRWCDTEYALTGGEEMSADGILAEVSRANPRLVCITGGEPLLQTDALIPVLKELHKRGIAIEIETNGTLDFASLQPYATICMDVKCPSSGEESDLSLLSKIRKEDSVKFVVSGEDDCRYAREVVSVHPVKGQVFFSPVWGADTAPIVRYIIRNDLPVRFQLQLHKIVGVK